MIAHMQCSDTEYISDFSRTIDTMAIMTCQRSRSNLQIVLERNAISISQPMLSTCMDESCRLDELMMDDVFMGLYESSMKRRSSM
jgi:hypothetical protein